VAVVVSLQSHTLKTELVEIHYRSVRAKGWEKRARRIKKRKNPNIPSHAAG
jgi:hypothetical protein